MKTTTIVFFVGFLPSLALAFVPFIDGGKGMPKIYDGWFNEQVSKQASAAVSRAIAAGKKKIEVNFPPVPNVDGTTMSYLFLPSANDICLIFPFFPSSNFRGQIRHTTEPEVWQSCHCKVRLEEKGEG
jgi:hypothetical protein